MKTLLILLMLACSVSVVSYSLWNAYHHDGLAAVASNVEAIKKTDWANKVYESDDPVKLFNGKYIDYYGESETTLDSVNYIDIDSDGSVDAVVTLQTDVNGSMGYYASYFVYSMDNGKLKKIFSTYREKADKIKITGKTFSVTAPKWVGDDPHSSPSKTEIIVYGWKNGMVGVISSTTEKYDENVTYDENVPYEVAYSSLVENMPSDLKPLAINYFKLNEECRGTPGISLEDKPCTDREAQTNQLEKLGWCYFEYNHTGYDSSAKWMLCKDHVEPTVFSLTKDNTWCSELSSKTIEDEINLRKHYDPDMGVWQEPLKLKNMAGSMAVVVHKDLDVFLFEGSFDECRIASKAINKATMTSESTDVFEFINGNKVHFDVGYRADEGEKLAIEKEENEKVLQEAEPTKQEQPQESSKIWYVMPSNAATTECIRSMSPAEWIKDVRSPGRDPLIKEGRDSSGVLTSVEVTHFDNDSMWTKTIYTDKSSCDSVLSQRMNIPNEYR